MDQNNSNAQNTTPIIPLRTNRGLGKFFFLSLLTFGIYGIVVMSHISKEINEIATKHDGKKTMHFCWIFFCFQLADLGNCRAYLVS